MEVYLCTETGRVLKSHFTERAIAYVLDTTHLEDNVIYFLADPSEVGI